MTMTSGTFIDTESRYSDGTWAIRLVHFNRGWRYWAFLIVEGAAVAGLSPDGYDTMAEARAALRAASEEADRNWDDRCWRCQGRGESDNVRCPKCGGSGVA